MVVTTHTLDLVSGMRIEVGALIDAEDAELLRAWGRAWDEVAPEWEAALNDLAASSQKGEWPSRTKVLRATRARKALDMTEGVLRDLVTKMGGRIAKTVPTLTRDAADWQAKIIGSQMPPPPGASTNAAVTATWDRVDPRALQSIVTRTTQQVTALSWPLPTVQTEVMKSVLIRGIAVGDNPKAAARTMLKRLGGQFEGGLARARVIARTEMMDAHHAASSEQRKANRDLLTGWAWQASLDVRTCPSCLAQHGSVHPLDEDGPLDHQQGRCTSLPITKTWKEMGFDIPEPPSVSRDAQAWFDSLPPEQQLSVLGKERLDLLHSGAIKWDDLSTRRENPDWRPSYVPTPLSDLKALSQNGKGIG